ncbi:unnamed protein product [Boreogadus saida]
MAKIGEVLKRDLKRQRTAQLESDSDDTCCDLFDEPKKRKPEAIAALCATSDDEDAIPQVESQRPGAVPAVFVEMSEDIFKALEATAGPRSTSVADQRKPRYSAADLSESEFRTRYSAADLSEFRTRYSAADVSESEFRTRYSAADVSESEFRTRYSAADLSESESRTRYSAADVSESEFRTRYSAADLSESEFRTRYSAADVSYIYFIGQLISGSPKTSLSEAEWEEDVPLHTGTGHIGFWKGNFGQGNPHREREKGELKEQLEPEKICAIIDAVRERFPNTEVAEIRALLRRKCNNESYKASSHNQS